MASKEELNEIYEKRIFTDEYLDEKMKFAFRYIFKCRSERFVTVAIREAVIDMGDHYYYKFIFWMTRQSQGVIRIYDESYNYKLKLKQVLNLISNNGCVIIGTIEDENNDSISENLTDWSRYVLCNVYRTVWHAELNVIHKPFKCLQENLNSLKSSYPYLLSDIEVQREWAKVASPAQTQEIWDKLKNDIEELKL